MHTVPSTATPAFARDSFASAGAAENSLTHAASGRRPDGVQEVIACYRPRLYGAASWIVGNPDDAEDVVQDVFLIAFQSLHLFKGDSAVFTWLYRIMVNRAVSLKRGVRRSVSLDSGSEGPGRGHGRLADDTGPEADLERAELVGWIQAALRRLSGEHREVLVMKDFDGMTYGEIAGALGVPIGTVRSRLYRARLDLRYLLGLSPNEGLPENG